MYVTWEALFFLILLGGILKMTGFIVQKLSNFGKWDFLCWLLAGFFFGGTIVAGYHAFLVPTPPEVRIGVTEVYRPTVHTLPEVRIEGRVR